MKSLCFVMLTLLVQPPLKMEPMPSRPAQPSPEQIKRFDAALRGLLLKAMPDPLYEKQSGDGNMAPSANGITWHGLKPSVQYKEKNDGTRQHIKLTSNHVQENLRIDLKNFQFHPEGRTTFDINLSLPARLEFTEERWKKGVKLYDGTVRARMKVWMVLHCESKMRVDGDGFLPTIVYRLRVVNSDFNYTDLVFEHVPGLGGEAAKIIGDLALDAVKQWKPGIERRLREKMEKSIVKAADTKEIRIGLTEFSVQGKKKSSKKNDEAK